MTILFDDDERESQEDEEEEETSSSAEADDSSSESSKGKQDSKDADADEDDDDEEFYDKTRALSTIQKLRGEVKEGKAAQRELEKLQKAQKKRERQEQSETERLNEDLKETAEERDSLKTENTKLRNRINRSSFIESIGFDTRIARQAWNSLDDAGIEPEFDDNYRLANKKAVLKALREYDSDLFGSGKSDAGKRARQEETDEVDMNRLIRQGFGRG